MEITPIHIVVGLSVFYILIIIVSALVGFLHYMYRNYRLEQLAEPYDKETLVSIIIPVYNEIEVIETTIRKLLKQTHKNIEIIVIDDHSTDGTYELLVSLMDEIPQLRVYRKKGVPRKPQSLNEALDYMTGDIALVIDADTILPENYIENHLPYIMSPFVDVLLSGYIGLNRNQNILTRMQDNMFAWAQLVTHGGLIGRSLLIGNGFFFKKKVIRAIGGWDPYTLVDDFSLVTKLYLMKKKLWFKDYPQTIIQLPYTWHDFIKQQIRWFAGGIMEAISGVIWGDMMALALLIFFSIVIAVLPVLIITIFTHISWVFLVTYVPVVLAIYGLSIASLNLERDMPIGKAIIEGLWTTIFLHYVYIVIPLALWDIIKNRGNVPWYKVKRLEVKEDE
ncbi:MAG: glycosyltransferase family 2 protein [Dictyoglomi bacterium]|nr:glycosyltransferase family 2 protein [Dictyoglomota bacterium]